MPTKIERISHASSGADVSNLGVLRKYTSEGSTTSPAIKRAVTSGDA